MRTNCSWSRFPFLSKHPFHWRPTIIYLQDHFERVEKCNEYFTLMSYENRGYHRDIQAILKSHNCDFQNVTQARITDRDCLASRRSIEWGRHYGELDVDGQPFRCELWCGDVHMNNVSGQADHIESDAKNEERKWSVLSPKLFNLFPGNAKTERIVSKGRLTSLV